VSATQHTRIDAAIKVWECRLSDAEAVWLGSETRGLYHLPWCALVPNQCIYCAAKPEGKEFSVVDQLILRDCDADCSFLLSARVFTDRNRYIMIVTLDHEVTFASLELILFAMALLVSVLFGLYLPKYSVRESQPDPSRSRYRLLTIT